MITWNILIRNDKRFELQVNPGKFYLKSNSDSFLDY